MPPLVMPMLVLEDDAIAEVESGAPRASALQAGAPLSVTAAAATAASRAVSSWGEEIEDTAWAPPAMPEDMVPPAPDFRDVSMRVSQSLGAPGAKELRPSYATATSAAPAEAAAPLRHLASPSQRHAAAGSQRAGHPNATHPQPPAAPVTVSAALEVESDALDATQLHTWAAVHKGAGAGGVKMPHAVVSSLVAVPRPHAAAAAAALPSTPRARDGHGTWLLVKGMACDWAAKERQAAAAAAAAPETAASRHPPPPPPHPPVASGWPVPVSDGSSLNVVACLCEIRGEALLAADSRERAAQWLLAALRCDLYSVRALQLLCSEHLLSDVDEVRLLRYVTAVAGMPESFAHVTTDEGHDEAAPGAPGACSDALRTRGAGDPRVASAATPSHGSTGAPVTENGAAGITERGNGVAYVPSPPRLDNSWLRDLYACRLNRFALGVTSSSKFAALEYSHGLGSNTDVLCSKADLLYAQHDPVAALAVSRRALAQDPFHRPLLLLHCALLVATREPDELHRLAQTAMRTAPRGTRMVEPWNLVLGDERLFLASPTDPTSWYATGCYYLAAGRPAAALQQLTRATQLDPAFAQAWSALGMAYAATEDTEPALAAYRVAQRLWPHSHVPALAMSSLCLRQGHTTLARQYMNLAAARCASDPLVYHEAGVAEYARYAAARGTWCI